MLGTCLISSIRPATWQHERPGIRLQGKRAGPTGPKRNSVCSRMQQEQSSMPQASHEQKTAERKAPAEYQPRPAQVPSCQWWPCSPASTGSQAPASTATSIINLSIVVKVLTLFWLWGWVCTRSVHIIFFHLPLSFATLYHLSNKIALASPSPTQSSQPLLRRLRPVLPVSKHFSCDLPCSILAIC